MRTIVVYESMFGNTRQIADAIAEGLAGAAEVTVVNVNLVKSEDLEAADLVLVGGPTHVHGMSRASTRAEAEKWTHDPARKLSLESGAPGRGIREWLDDGATVPKNFAAFATRVNWPIIVSGNAAAQIDREFDLRGRGLRLRLRRHPASRRHPATRKDHGLQKSHHCGDARCSGRGMRTM